MSDSNHPLYRLRKKSWLTSGARFNAESRLNKRHRAEISSIAILSVFSIIVNLVPEYYNNHAYIDYISRYCGFVSVTFSVIILAFSFVTIGSNNINNASKLLYSGKIIRSLSNKCSNIISTVANYNIDELQQIYDDAIDNCPVNHDSTDFFLFCERNKKDKYVTQYHDQTSFSYFTWKIRWHLCAYFPYYITTTSIVAILTSAMLFS